ncbi:NUDIX domain-containing protein [Saccharopolyspora griseoalba]|uniref:NUDIX domain-containing protein n=1 Tax=Saccharopolyspora griseoalba TaxID=1431848 RepID=A0ABW2LQP4_9PSEU
MTTTTPDGETAQLTADVAVFHQDTDGVLWVLVIERGYAPYAGHLALPGGFLEPGEASIEAAYRELTEETSIGLRPLVESGRCSRLVKIGVYDTPGRDPRGRVSTTAYAVVVDEPMTPEAADDAAAASWKRVDDVLAGALAFDHAEILADAVEAIRPHLAGSDLAGDSDQVRELYRERAHLVAVLAAQFPARIAYNDPREPTLPVLYLDTTAGQVSYHLNPEDVALFGHVPVVDGDISSAVWDRHNKATALQRLRQLAQLETREANQ